MLPEIEIALQASPDYDKINSIGDEIFKLGKFELLDEYMLLVAPLINKSYYKYISTYDDRYYAREDLVQDVYTILYRDMKLRWDKYIRVEDYYKYISVLATNIMMNLVHNYHSYYKNDEYDPEFSKDIMKERVITDKIEYRIMMDSVKTSIVDKSMELANNRGRLSSIILRIIDCKYGKNSNTTNIDKLKYKFRVVMISNNEFKHCCYLADYYYKLAYNYQKSSLREDGSMLQILENIFSRFGSLTYKILVDKYADSIIPEIFAEFGSEIARKFVKSFSGRTITVPNYDSFKDDLLAGMILTLSKCDKNRLYDIAVEYDLPYKMVKRIYDNSIHYMKDGE